MDGVKLVIVGDGGVGKSSFLISATTNHFPSDYVPTVFDSYSSNVIVKGKPISVSLWDTAGQEDYDRLRPLSYPQTDVFVVSFDVRSRISFQNVRAKWIPEVSDFAPNVPILLLATKTDLRDGYNPSLSDRQIVKSKEGKSLADSLGVTYAECSSLLNDGVQQALHTAVELAVNNIHAPRCFKPSYRGFKMSKRKTSNYFDNENKLLPPVLPPAGFAPHVEVLTSSFANILDDIYWVCDDKDCCPNRIHNEEICIGKGKTVITLHKSLSKNIFMEVLTFLYTGSPDLAGNEDVNFVKEVQSVSIKFQLNWLETYCTNILKGESFLNPSIGTWINDSTGLATKKLFLNKELQADVKFCVKGSIVFGHKVILKARSEVMAAMLSGAFREGDLNAEINIQDASLESFLALLEYLYTDHAPIEEGNSVEIMVLADRFCLPRLVTLCELYITKKVDRAVQKKVADGTSDVIDLLFTSQAHNAKQLSGWCLHFIATNFSVFENCEEFHLVQGENRDYIDEHRWPPLSYIKAQEEYEMKVKSDRDQSKCSIM
ncbi:rho-related protein racA-like isoform X2 [Acropora muricata]|uniref:rho-related protein racA-like isoform X2 n=1 Tax=Acropora muricata TaxID=159855 RepID=UPI0034E5B5D3